MMSVTVAMAVVVMMALTFLLILTHNVGYGVAVSVRMGVRMAVGMIVTVRMTVVVRVTVVVRMTVVVRVTVVVRMTVVVGMVVVVMPLGFSIEAPSIGPKDIELYCVDLAANNRAGAHRQLVGGKAKPCKAFFHHAKRHTGIQQCTNGHIAADPRETIEICNLHPLAPKLEGKDRDFRGGLRGPPLLQKC